jgi:hypothetical protein
MSNFAGQRPVGRGLSLCLLSLHSGRSNQDARRTARYTRLNLIRLFASVVRFLYGFSLYCLIVPHALVIGFRCWGAYVIVVLSHTKTTGVSNLNVRSSIAS